MKRKAFFIFTFLLASCASVEARNDLAQSIVNDSELKKSEIDGGFKLRAYQRISNHIEANVYIEGDGLAWLSRSRKSINPTPTDPVALRLAAQDGSTNVVYLARPCQYVQDDKCNSDYWGKKRFAPEVIAAYMHALDSYGFKKINLIGYSGGAAIAIILAAKRSDIMSLRTVAGNVDIDAFSELHNVSKLSGSINPADYAKQIWHIPQIHFVGDEDNVATSILSVKYHNTCSEVRIVKGVSHEDGWAENWSKLLRHKPSCVN